VVPWVQRPYPSEKYVFQQIYLAPVHTGQDHPAVFGEILNFGVLAANAGFEFAGVLYMACFTGKRPGNVSCQFDHPTSAHHRRMGLSENTSAGPSAHSAASGKHITEKNEVEIE
jgi:hypothetical protein